MLGPIPTFLIAQVGLHILRDRQPPTHTNQWTISSCKLVQRSTSGRTSGKPTQKQAEQTTSRQGVVQTRMANSSFSLGKGSMESLKRECGRNGGTALRSWGQPPLVALTEIYQQPDHSARALWDQASVWTACVCVCVIGAGVVIHNIRRTRHQYWCIQPFHLYLSFKQH